VTKLLLEAGLGGVDWLVVISMSACG
jgi:hypothetical protein